MSNEDTTEQLLNWLIDETKARDKVKEELFRELENFPDELRTIISNLITLKNEFTECDDKVSEFMWRLRALDKKYYKKIKKKKKKKK